MKRTFTAGALALALVAGTIAVPAAAQSSSFDDVPEGNVHRDAIERGVELGIVQGTTRTTFAPRRDLSRGQAASLLARTLQAAEVDLPAASEGADFPDAEEPHRDALRQLEAAGIFLGTEEGHAEPGRELRRDQFAALTVRAVEFAWDTELEPADDPGFTDVDGNVHREDIAAATDLELFAGTSGRTFAPAAHTRRDQAATVSVSLFDVLAAPQEVTTDRGEIWALDQGTDLIHVHDGDDDFTEIATIDVRPTTLAADFEHAPSGDFTVPHMIEFDSQERYAFVASTAGGVTLVIDARRKEVVEVLPTGAGTHMAAVVPDDSAVWVAAIGAQAMVEITIDDLDAAEPTFEIARTLAVDELLEPLEAANGWEYPSASPVCHQYTSDGSEAWITLGPGWDQGALVVLDLDTGELVAEAAYDPAEVKANCGVSVTDDQVVVNWSGKVTAEENTAGEWYVIDPVTYDLEATRPANGLDTHGLRLTPDGAAYWQVNRLSDELLVIDAQTLEVVAAVDGIADTPDILDFSPDGQLAYITQRGPTPRSGAIHAATGDQPGVAVVDVATYQTVTVIEHGTVTDGDGRVVNDVHGVGVRTATDADVPPAAQDASVAPAAAGDATSFRIVAPLHAPRPVADVPGFHCEL